MENKEQNYFDQNNQITEPQKDDQNKKVSYLILFGLSIFSALAILSLWVMFQSGWLGLLFVFVIVTAQIILIIPFTLLVFFVYRSLSRRNQLPEIRLSTRVGVPLIFNILAVSAFL